MCLDFGYGYAQIVDEMFLDVEEQTILVENKSLLCSSGSLMA